MPKKIHAPQLVYRDPIQTISKVVAEFEGFNKEYYVADHGLRAALVAVRGEDILLVRQYRLLIDGLSYEIPGGRIEEGETPEGAAVRECLEETGVRCRALKPLVAYHPGLDVYKNYTRIFVSNECTETAPGDPGTREWIPLSRCLEMIFEGKIADSLTIIALLAYRNRRSGP